MTVIEYLNFVYELKGCTEDRESHLSEIMATIRLTDVKNRLIKNLSKGYKQRVGIAEALIGDPKIVIFDEPTVGLDPKQILEVRNLIRALAKKHTVILSTHILAEVQAVCERVIIINKGKIIADSRTDELTKTIEDGYRYKVKICGPSREVTQALERVRGIRSVSLTNERELDSLAYLIESERGYDARKSIFSLCSERGWPIIGMMPIGTDLESIFIRLVEKSDGVELPGKKQKRRAH